MTCITQVATSAADRDRIDVIAEMLITVSMTAMTAFCLLRQRNLESEPNERGQSATEAERHCDHRRLHDALGDFAPPSQMSEVALRLDRKLSASVSTFEKRLYGFFQNVLAGLRFSKFCTNQAPSKTPLPMSLVNAVSQLPPSSPPV
jgi:hypothetical protein